MTLRLSHAFRLDDRQSKHSRTRVESDCIHRVPRHHREPHRPHSNFPHARRSFRRFPVLGNARARGGRRHLPSPCRPVTQSASRGAGVGLSGCAPCRAHWRPPQPAPAPATPTANRSAAPADPEPEPAQHATHRDRPGTHRGVPAARGVPGALREGRAARHFAPARASRARRAQHGGEPRGAHRNLGAHHPREADHGQPRGHQQPPGAHARRQGELHAPDRLRDCRGARGVPRDERRLRARGRQACDVHACARELWARDRPREGRRLASAARAEHQGRGPDGLRAVLARLRRRRQEGAHRRAPAHRLPGHDPHSDQPRHARHGALRAATDARPGRHHRRRVDGLSGRIPGII